MFHGHLVVSRKYAQLNRRLWTSKGADGSSSKEGKSGRKDRIDGAPLKTTCLVTFFDGEKSRWIQRTKGVGKTQIQRTKGTLVKHGRINIRYQKGVLDIWLGIDIALPNGDLIWNRGRIIL